MIAHIGQNYGYETLMTELPTFMKQVLRFDIQSVSMTILCGFLVVMKYKYPS